MNARIIVIEALALLLVATEQQPAYMQDPAKIAGIKELLSAHEPVLVSVKLAQAKCLLNPELDPIEVYRGYGITKEDE